jgi:hypothetical protein
VTHRILGLNVDERFLDHRRRSTSFAAAAGAIVTGALFEDELILHHHVAWELLSVLLTMFIVKFAAMTWFHFTD